MRQSFEKLRFELAEDPFEQNIFAVIRRTNPPLDGAPARRLGGDDFGHPSPFGTGQTVLECAPVAWIGKLRRDIVEQDGEGAHTSVVKAPCFAQENTNGAIVAEVQSLAGVKTVDEIDSLRLCGSNQT